jgi:5'-nucleotidase/UDP-sugar diphosphatase
MRRLLLFLLLLTFIPLVPSAKSQTPAAFSLEIFHTNDEHAHHRANQDGVGGAARLATVLNEARANNPGILLFDAGDRFSGTLFHYFYKGDDQIDLMNALGYDAMALGNHEFDNGSEILANFIAGVDFPVLATNVDASRDPFLNGMIQRHTVLDVDGLQAGVIGLVTPATRTISQPEETVSFGEDLIAITNDAALELTQQGVTVVILLSHQGFTEDINMARQLSNIDIVIGGHSNTVPANYPLEVTDADGNLVLVVQAGFHGRHVGHLTTGFDSNGHVVTSRGNVITLDESYPEDPQIVALLDELEAPLASITEEVIGQSAFDFRRESCFGGNACDLGALVTDAMLEATGADIAVINSGALRGDILQGDITYGNILSVLPFANQVSVFELAGSDVIAMFEHGVSSDIPGAFPQIAGAQVIWRADSPPGQRVASIDIRNGDEWIILDPNSTYVMASVDFIRNGGDGYTILATSAKNPYDSFGLLDQIVVNYIAANSPVESVAEGRIRRE